MNGQIAPNGFKTVGNITYLYVYLPLDGRSLVARKQPYSGGMLIDYATIKNEDFDAALAAPEKLEYKRGTDLDANLGVLFNQLGTVNAATGVSSTVTDPTDRPGRLLGHVTVDNFPTNWTGGSATAGATDVSALAKDATLTDGTQKARVTNWPATQQVGGSVAVSNFPAPVTSVSVSNLPTTQAVSGSLSINNFPAPVTSVQVSNLPATQPVSGPLTDGQLRSAPVAVAGDFYPDTQQVSIAVMPTTPVTGNFYPAVQAVSGPLTDSQLRAAPVAVNGTVIVANPTSPTDVSALAKDATLTSGAQKTQVTNTVPVTGPLTDTQLRATALPVAGDFYPATQAVSIATMPTTPVVGTFWQATQPVSAASLPLPAGAATEATLAAIKAKTDNIDVLLSTRTKPADTQKVDGSGVTQPVSAAALPLPAGASTAALQTSMGAQLAALVTNSPTLVSGRLPVDIGGATVTASFAPKTSGGVSGKLTLANGVSATPTVVKATAGQVYHLFAGNTSSSAVYVNLYDKATAPAAGDTPKEMYLVPAGGTLSRDFVLGSQFTNGIGLAITSNISLLGSLTGLLTANVVIVTVHYA
jgi:hypothetical protein